MSKSTPKWKVVREKTYEKFPIFELKKSTRINPRTLKPVDFARIDGLDWANVIALTPQNEVVLIRQYRHGSEEWTLELPGGCVEIGEDPKASALRELKEEAGYAATEAIHLGSVRANPALMSISCHFYLARNATRAGDQALDPGEDIQVVLEPLERVEQMLLSGEINHALHVAAFGIWKMRGFKIGG